MAFNIPLFAFGVCITLLVVIGVLLALAEFRQAQAAPRPEDQVSGRLRTPRA